MVSIFHPRLINGPFEDPGLFVPFSHEKRALIFDLGNIYPLSPRNILKISHIFISHTHMDHFIGFDHLLRIMLGRSKTLAIYGPRGILKHIEGKLSGYTWNLVENYNNHFSLQVYEIHSDYLIYMDYNLQNKFEPISSPKKIDFTGIILNEAALSVSIAILDHIIPCLGFSIQERFHVNIKKNELSALGLDVGPWLKDFKNALYEQQPPDTQFEICTGKESDKKKILTLGELSEKIAHITKGQKIAYITDIGYTKDNINKVLTLCHEADHLFIEAAFLEEEKDMAKEKYHLTARQAGEIAGLAHAKRFTLFHFSPRYMENDQLLYDEAIEAYNLSIK